MRSLAIALAMCFALVSPVLAADLGQAKASGQLGEQADGYLGLVDAGAPADVKALMAEVNAKRAAKYGEIAAARGVPIEAVAKITAQKVFESAEPGTYLLDTNGQWRQK